MNELSYPTYQNYKDSGVPWLGEIPEGWEVLKAKYLWREIEERSINGEDLLLSVSQYSGIQPRQENSRSEDLVGYKIVYPKHLVTNIMLAWMGALGISSHKGVVSPAYAVYRLTSNQNADFLGYLYKTNIYLAEFARRSSGVVPSRWRMYTEDFGQVLTLLPPLSEQDRIVAFLDRKTAEIDEAIAKKQRLIELLNEQKAILINRAVTRGLNPDAPLKDSGVPWIGEIPAHWEVKRVKHLLSSSDYGLSESSLSDGNFKIIGMGNISEGRVNTEGSGYLTNVPASMILKDGDILFNRTNSFDLVGKCGIFRNNHQDDVTFASYLVRLRVMPNVSSEWLNYVFMDEAYLGFIRSLALRSLSQANLNPNRLGSVQVPCPPFEEQIEINNYIYNSINIVNLVIKNALEVIYKLQEYKQTLIAHAVTGKIRVPEVAP